MSRHDDYYELAKAQLAGLGVANGAVAAHAETKVAAHVAANAITDVTLTINNIPH